MAANKTVKAVAKALVAAVPEGWQVEHGKGGIDLDGSTHNCSPAYEWVRFTTTTDGGAKVEVALEVSPIRKDARPWVLEGAFMGAGVEGHTILNGGSFTRRGIDCSSCGLSDTEKRHDRDTAGSVPALLASQLQRCRESLAASATAEAVPGLPFRRQPSWFVAATKALQSGRVVSLAPAGFGVGYALSGRRGGPRADAALEARLGVSPIYVSTFDHD